MMMRMTSINLIFLRSKLHTTTALTIMIAIWLRGNPVTARNILIPFISFCTPKITGTIRIVIAASCTFSTFSISEMACTRISYICYRLFSHTNKSSLVIRFTSLPTTVIIYPPKTFVGIFPKVTSTGSEVILSFVIIFCCVSNRAKSFSCFEAFTFNHLSADRASCFIIICIAKHVLIDI